MQEKDVTYYKSIDTIKEGNGQANAQILQEYSGMEVMVGIRTSDKKNIFVNGILSGPDFYVCHRDHKGRLYNPIALNTKKITGLLVKIYPTWVSAPGDAGADLTVRC